MTKMMTITSRSYESAKSKAPTFGKEGYELTLEENYADAMQQLALLDLRMQAASVQEMKRLCDKKQGFMNEDTKAHDHELSKSSKSDDRKPASKE